MCFPVTIGGETLLGSDESRIVEEFAIQFPNEADHQFKARKKYFVQTFINTSQDLVSAPINSVFGQSIKEDYSDKNSMIKTFHENVTIGDDPLTFKTYLKDFVGVGLRSYGNVFTVVDKPRGESQSRMDERQSGMPFLSNIRPQDVLNWSIINGELQWFAYKGAYRS